MIPAIFDRDWVHPWGRPAEEGHSVRLGVPPVRVVSPVPPHEPEPHPGEPFAPVYDYVPLPSASLPVDEAEPLPPDRYPDPVVSGPPGSRELLAGWNDGWDGVSPIRSRGTHSSQWSGDAGCWCCERPA